MDCHFKTWVDGSWVESLYVKNSSVLFLYNKITVTTFFKGQGI